MDFASDNAGPAHPEVMAALLRANDGHVPSYGADALTTEVVARLRDLFEAPEAAVFLVATGTAANALALATLTQPWQSIFCSPLAHVETDECNAPEFFTGGAKLTLVGEGDRMTPEALRAAIAARDPDDVHTAQRGAVALTNVTERGQLYSGADLAALCAVAREFDLPVHLDGARFANACVATDVTPAEMTWKIGIDAVTFGGTKNGLLDVEAVLFFDPRHGREFAFRRKRAGHLHSKHRFLSAQMQAYLDNDLWRDTARAANGKAARLASGLRGCAAVRLTAKPQANVVFCEMSAGLARRLKAGGARFPVWSGSLDGAGDAAVEVRLVCDWSLPDAEIDRFLHLLRAEADQPAASSTAMSS